MQRKQIQHRIQGSAIIELAICLPILVFLVFGTIEVSGSIFLKQTLTSAAHEGALTGMRLNSQEQDIIDRVNSVLTSRGVVGCTVTVVPTGTTFVELKAGELFRVQIQRNTAYQYIDLSGVSVSVATQRQ